MTGGFALRVSQLEDARDRFIVVDKTFFGCTKEEECNSEIIQALLFCKILMHCNAVTPRKVCAGAGALACLMASLMVRRSSANWDREVEVATCQCAAWPLPSSG